MNNKIINSILLLIFLFGILFFLNNNSMKKKILLENFNMDIDQTIKFFKGLEEDKKKNFDKIHTHSHPITHTHTHNDLLGKKKGRIPLKKASPQVTSSPVTSASAKNTEAGGNIKDFFTTDLTIDTKEKKCSGRKPRCPTLPPPSPPATCETGCPANQPSVEKHIYNSCEKALPNREANVKINLKDYVHKCNIPKPVDMSKYILKTQIPVCPDMDNYIKKSEIPSCPILPDMSKYILKSSIPSPKQCPSLDKYVLKSSVPQQQTCPPCPDLNISCKKNDLEELKEKEKEKEKDKKPIKSNIDILSMGKIDKSVKKKECSLLGDSKIYKNGIYGPY